MRRGLLCLWITGWWLGCVPPAQALATNIEDVRAAVKLLRELAATVQEDTHRLDGFLADVEFQVSTNNRYLQLILDDVDRFIAIELPLLNAQMHTLALSSIDLGLANYLTQCADGADNDGDTKTDFGNLTYNIADPQCASAADNDESQ